MASFQRKKTFMSKHERISIKKWFFRKGSHGQMLFSLITRPDAVRLIKTLPSKAESLMQSTKMSLNFSSQVIKSQYPLKQQCTIFMIDFFFAITSYVSFSVSHINTGCSQFNGLRLIVKPSHRKEKLDKL